MACERSSDLGLDPQRPPYDGTASIGVSGFERSCAKFFERDGRGSFDGVAVPDILLFGNPEVAPPPVAKRFVATPVLYSSHVRLDAATWSATESPHEFNDGPIAYCGVVPDAQKHRQRACWR